MRVGTFALAIAFTLCMVSALPQGSDAQDVSSLTLRTTMSMTALDSVDGRGNVVLTFEGEAANELRRVVLANFDSNWNEFVDGSEARAFLSALGDEISGKQYWGIHLTSLTNYSTIPVSGVVSRTTGLVNSVPTTTGPISFDYDFECGGEDVSTLVRLSELATQTFLGSLTAVSEFELEGTLKVRDRVAVFGLGSFTRPDLTHGSLSELRTPIGSVMWYSLDLEVGGAVATPGETLGYERFNIYENQQMAFIAFVIACGLVLRLPPRRFEKYRMEHPKKYRKSARPLVTVRAFSWGMFAFLCVMYLFPFVFSPLDPNILVYSLYFYFIGAGVVVGSYVFARSMYGLASMNIPEDLEVEVKQAVVMPDEPGDLRCQICMMPIDAGLDLYECVCGYTMHMGCAERAQSCPHCGEVLFPEHTRSIECRACGETFLTSSEEDPFTLQCTRCGAFQEEVEPAKNYLVVDIDAKRGYNMLRSMGLSGRPALVLTAEFPGKIREEHDLGDDFDVKWLTDATSDIDSVNIKDLEGDVMETISTFLMTTKRSGLLVDGIETIISENGFDAALAFVRRMNDLATIHGSSVMMWMDRNRLPDGQYGPLSEEFEEIHDYL